MAQIDELARFVQDGGEAQQEECARLEAVFAFECAEKLCGGILHAFAVPRRRAVLFRRRARELQRAAFLLREARKLRHPCALVSAVALQESRSHEEETLDPRGAHDLVVEQDRRQEEIGAALGNLAALHELLRRHGAEGIDET